jgi:K+-transporting ATPase KdpF subunit
MQPSQRQGAAAMMQDAILLTIVVLVLAYLVFALLRPERF